MDYRFYLDNIEVDEPEGFSDLELSIKRDDIFHGIGYEASTGTLQFYDKTFTGATYLEDQKNLYGLQSNVAFRADIICDTEPEEISLGRVNFGGYKKTCGNECTVSVPIEQEGCIVTLNSRFDQKVDIDSVTAFDKITALPPYVQMGQDISLPAKELKAVVEGYVVDEGDVIDNTFPVAANLAYFFVRPAYGREIYNSIATGNLAGGGTGEILQMDPSPGVNDQVVSFVSPQLLMEENPKCFTDFDYSFRLKGSWSLITGHLDFIRAQVITWDGTGRIDGQGTIITTADIHTTATAPDSGVFDESFSGTITLNEGIGLYCIIYCVCDAPTVDGEISFTFDKESYTLIEGIKACPATDTKYYLIHETLSRIAEAITDYCVRVKSSYFGRIDSEPFSFPSDGCGGLRMLTSGLKIRNADNATFFASMKDLMGGLNSIDNIGFDVITDPDRPNNFLMRVEGVGFFYQNVEIMRLDFIPKATIETNESGHYSIIKIGYKKWEVEEVNGLDEINSNREYRTSLSSVSNTLDQTSSLMAGSYSIEITRGQQFADSGAADTKYDNDIFIIVLRRNVYGYEVEQGNIVSASGIFSPTTLYNYRISPLRNLMRWYKSVINSYSSIGGSGNKLFFSAGTGNITACGEQLSSDCKIESGIICESQDLFVSNFLSTDFTPLWRNDIITFEYPLSVKDYNLIKANPYGYISFQCGSSAYDRGFIKEIKYRPAQGMATFILKRKWQ